ncbi:MAG: hypothetical protein V1914_03515 [archaeon]
MRIRSFIQILNIANISFRHAEEYIIYFRDTSSKPPFKVKFPYPFTPLHFRIIGALFGDGNVHKKNKMARWIQKDPTPMLILFEYLIDSNFKIHTNSMQITIPAFFTKMAAKILKLDQINLGSEKLLEASSLLPKIYRFVLLLAIIEDEGNIDVKNYGCVSIRISSEKGIYLIEQLCDSLDYKTSEIKRYINNGTFGTNFMYKLNILSKGIEQLGYDLLEFELNYGCLGSLWKKRDPFFERWKICARFDGKIPLGYKRDGVYMSKKL